MTLPWVRLGQPQMLECVRYTTGRTWVWAEGQPNCHLFHQSVWKLILYFVDIKKNLIRVPLWKSTSHFWRGGGSGVFRDRPQPDVNMLFLCKAIASSLSTEHWPLVLSMVNLERVTLMTMSHGWDVVAAATWFFYEGILFPAVYIEFIDKTMYVAMRWLEILPEN